MRLDLKAALTTTPHAPKWVIEGIIPAGTTVLQAGDAGVGKSTMNLAEGMHVALAREFLCHRTFQTRVLYFDEENSKPDIYAYLQRLWVGMGCPDQALLEPWFRVEHFSLGVSSWPDRMAALVAEWQPGLIYIDTATSALAIVQENDNSEAQVAVQRLRRAAGPECAIKVLKHAKFESGGNHQGGTRRTIRGAKAWLGAVDQTMYHIKASGGRPRKDGLHQTILVPDKRRAFGLRHHIRITPVVAENNANGLILKGEIFTPEKDLMIVPGNQ